MGIQLKFELKDIKIDKVALDHVFNEPAGDVGRWMHRRGVVSLGAAKSMVGVDTGRLKAAISMKHDRAGPGRMQQIRIGTFVGPRGYALYHHEGTKAHTISSKSGRLLTFNVRGKRVFARVVKHPAQKGNPYLTRSFKVFMGP
jgi:hypothetical protein